MILFKKCYVILLVLAVRKILISIYEFFLTTTGTSGKNWPVRDEDWKYLDHLQMSSKAIAYWTFGQEDEYFWF